MTSFSTSLAIGGTGMLANATRWLISQSETTILIARRATQFETHRRVRAVDADWHSPSFPDVVRSALRAVPEVEAALLWMHQPEPVLAWLASSLANARTVLVLGSMDGRPAVPAAAGSVTTVRLGSTQAASGRRWLTNEEISGAAIASLQDGANRVVGDLEPP